MTKTANYFYIADRHSQKFIIKANIDNKLFADNATIAHVYVCKDKFRVFIHERAACLNDPRAVSNPSYGQRKNEKYSDKFEYTIERAEKATPKQREAEDKKALKALVQSFEELAKNYAETLDTVPEA